MKNGMNNVMWSLIQSVYFFPRRNIRVDNVYAKHSAKSGLGVIVRLGL